MTRYQTAVATLSMWLTKARTPSDARPLSLHVSSWRPDVAPRKPLLLVRLWRGIGARRRRHDVQTTKNWF